MPQLNAQFGYGGNAMGGAMQAQLMGMQGGAFGMGMGNGFDPRFAYRCDSLHGCREGLAG
jgi:hypothetical protein